MLSVGVAGVGWAHPAVLGFGVAHASAPGTWTATGSMRQPRLMRSSPASGIVLGRRRRRRTTKERPAMALDKKAVIDNGLLLFKTWVEGGVNTSGAIAALLADDVVLVDYDEDTAFVGKANVLNHLQTLVTKTAKVTLHGTRAGDRAIVGLDHLDYKNPAVMPSHECVDLYKVNDLGLVTEIRVCFVKS
jgi:hypothetical protein